MMLQEFKKLVAKVKLHVAQQRKSYPQARVQTQKALRLEKLSAVAPALEPVASAKAPIAADPHPKQPWAANLEDFRAQICNCLNCPLGASRKRFMFGSGNPKAKLVFFGLAPQIEEENLGQLFSGEAGTLLTKMIGAMGFRREEVYLMNALKCSLPQGRHEAGPEELDACRPYYEQQLRLIAPKVICALGPEATTALLGVDADFSRSRGKFFESKGWLVMPTYHPAELMRHEGLKRQAWEDLKALLKKIS